MYEKNPDYACKSCWRSFKNKRALKQHRRDVHETQTRSADDSDSCTPVHCGTPTLRRAADDK